MNIPAHIGLIMDGNGRWATRRELTREKGHKEGVEALVRTLDSCYEAGIYAVSIYAFSTENWKRPKREVDKIFDILREYLESSAHKLLEQDVRFISMGDETALPKDLQAVLMSLKAKTAQCKKHVFCMGLNYGGRAEIVRAVNQLLKSGVQKVDEATFAQYLYTAGLPEPDLIIRTAGEQRLSNFLSYQSAYSELYFTEVLWPDFGTKDLQKALEWYASRKRSYGSVPKQE